MNRKSVQFQSAEERKREVEFCKHYGAIGIPAVVAATALKEKRREQQSDEESPQK